MISDATHADLNLSLTHLLHRACQVADSLFAEEAGDTGLTTRQFTVLVAIGNNRDISQTGIVQVTGIDRSTVAEIIKRLLKRGLIRRRRTRMDARAYAVRLSPEGEDLLQSALPAVARVEERLIAALAGLEPSDLMSGLSQLVDALPPAK